MIYLDGSALCRFLPGVRHYEEFGAWALDHLDELVTTQLGFTELRQAAELYPRSAADRVSGIVETVRTGVAVIRFSDDNVAISSHATAVLKPFAALHVGAAVAHEKVDTIVTYDPALASVARIYDLAVVSPGLPQNWYAEYEGPSEHWKPVALDAPYAPGAEFDTPEMTPKADAYEDALREAEAEAAAKAAREAAEAIEAPEGDAAEAIEAPEGEVTEAIEAPEGEVTEAIEAPEGEVTEAIEAPEGEVTEFEQALREAEDAARGSDEDAARGSEEGSEQRSDVDMEPASEPGYAGIGTYHPRVEAWRAGDDHGHDSMLEPKDRSGEPGAEGEGQPKGGGLPWAQRPEPEVTAPPESPPQAPPPLLRTEEHTIEAEGSPLEAPPALAPPTPVEPPAVPNLPRELRGVPPVAPAVRPSMGSPARRPMFETEPRPDSRASRPPDPVPPTPPEESKPLTVPIKWNVELDEPEAYSPVRVESSGVRALPSFPVSFAGGQGGLTLASSGAVSVPSLEPRGAEGSVYPVEEGVRSRAVEGAGSVAPSARDRRSAEKAAKKERERIAKLAKSAKGASPSAPAPPQQASGLPSSPAAPAQAASSPTATSDTWKLDDVVSLGEQKKRDA